LHPASVALRRVQRIASAAVLILLGQDRLPGRPHPRGV
jgi:hypothetical protein